MSGNILNPNIDIDKLQNLLIENNLLINLTGRQRMLSQKIAFLCEMILRGDESKVGNLKMAVDLFENSLFVIKNGGVPPELDTIIKISPISDTLMFTVSHIESNWQIYKKSAENIIKFASIGYDNSSISKDVMMMQIRIIENNCESLLKSCNNLVTDCSNYYEKQIILLFNEQ